LVADDVYVDVPLPWHLDVAPDGTDGVPTVGVRVTLKFCVEEGPLHPLALTLTVAVPLKPEFQVTTPELLIVPTPEGAMLQL
jgi:hypothetical protein